MYLEGRGGGGGWGWGSSQEDSSYFLNKKDPISISLFLDHYFYHIGAQNARADNKHLKGFKEETLGTNYNHQMWEKSFH